MADSFFAVADRGRRFVSNILATAEIASYLSGDGWVGRKGRGT
jgi:hypothetical protein